MLPLSWVERAARYGILRRPRLLCVDVHEGPLHAELQSTFLYREIRGGYAKWAHFLCPRCGDHIQVPISKSPESWRITVNWLRRPTLSPSIWETQSCGAHFFIRAGNLVWCKEHDDSR